MNLRRPLTVRLIAESKPNEGRRSGGEMLTFTRFAQDASLRVSRIDRRAPVEFEKTIVSQFSTLGGTCSTINALNRRLARGGADAGLR